MPKTPNFLHFRHFVGMKEVALQVRGRAEWISLKSCVMQVTRAAALKEVQQRAPHWLCGGTACKND